MKEITVKLVKIIEHSFRNAAYSKAIETDGGWLGQSYLLGSFKCLIINVWENKRERQFQAGAFTGANAAIQNDKDFVNV